ncbi:MAG TPA: threonine/serine dehydratase [Thermomicrobiales bacterium]|nr:threonine/serine dehydratase [Thermomicrobiales bacterium]
MSQVRDSVSNGATSPTVPSGGETSGMPVGDAMGTRNGEPDSVSWTDVTVQDVHDARVRIMPHLHRTPLLGSDTLSRMTGTNLGLKAEVFQKTGSFKTRGALNAALQLTADQRERGLITISAGNHGQGLAWAGSMVGARTVVFMPKTAVPTKVNAIRGYGAEPMFSEDMESVFTVMEAYRAEHGMTFISPFSHPAIIAGQGVVGLEILEDMPEVENVIVPVGGGGLISGISLAIRSQRPDVRVVGVEPEGANIVRQSLDAGKPLAAGKIATVADGLAAPFAGDLSQAVIERYVSDVVLVPDSAIVDAMGLILDRCKVLVEPAGAAALAGLLSGQTGAKPGSNTVVILSGGNVDREKLKTLL